MPVREYYGYKDNTIYKVYKDPVGVKSDIEAKDIKDDTGTKGIRYDCNTKGIVSPKLSNCNMELIEETCIKKARQYAAGLDTRQTR